jgi:hypothetical protein
MRPKACIASTIFLTAVMYAAVRARVLTVYFKIEIGTRIAAQKMKRRWRWSRRARAPCYGVKDIKKRKKENLSVYALGDHCVGYFEETRDVCAHDVVTQLAEELGGVVGILVDVDHDAV